MITKKEVYRLTERQLEKYRLEREKVAAQHLKNLIKIYPQAEKLNSELKSYSFKLAQAILKGDSDSKEKIKNITDNAQNAKAKIDDILKECGKPQDYLNPKPHCFKCDDTGYLQNGSLCPCRKKIAGRIISRHFKNESCLTVKSFGDFDLSYYPKDKNKKYNVSPYDQMSAIFEKCQKYAEKFTLNSNGLLMIGATGLGKTHLSLSIAKEVMEKGYLAIYMTAFELSKKLSDLFFSKTENTNDLYYFISEADLLIIDDLGTEPKTDLNVSSICEVINRRLINKKPIIISTNLNAQEIAKRYSKRTTSRFFSELDSLHFMGNDIRQIKSM